MVHSTTHTTTTVGEQLFNLKKEAGGNGGAPTNKD